MTRAQRLAVVRDVLERASAIRDLSVAYCDAANTELLDTTIANAQIELAFLESPVWLHRLPACDCGCRDCDHP